MVKEDNSLLPTFGQRVQGAMETLDNLLDRWSEDSDQGDEQNQVLSRLDELAADLIGDDDSRRQVVEYVRRVVSDTGISDLAGLVNFLTSTQIDIEPPLDPDGINIMTMHKAKGLTARAVIVAASEDQLTPGAQLDGNQMDDERRLLYVSLTRARTHLYITYCDERTGQQMYTGRDSGRRPRTLTRFLRNAPIQPTNGIEYVR